MKVGPASGGSSLRSLDRLRSLATLTNLIRVCYDDRPAPIRQLAVRPV